MVKPRVSIIILNRNGEKYLNRTLTKVIGLKYQSKEIIVIDNKSSDNSKEIVSRFSNITLIESGVTKKNTGVNMGIKSCFGELILLLDNDIEINDMELLDKLLKYYYNENSIGFISPVLLEDKKDTTHYYQGPIGWTGVKRIKLLNHDQLNNTKEQLYRTQFILAGAIFFEKKVWNHLKGYDDSFPFNMDDYDISIRAHIMGYKNYMFLNHPLSLHLGSGTELSNKYFRWRFDYLLAGQIIANLKNYSLPYMFLFMCTSLIRVLLVTIKQTVIRRDFLLLFTYIKSLFIAFKNIPNALHLRKYIQSKRLNKDYSLINFKIKIKN